MLTHEGKRHQVYIPVEQAAEVARAVRQAKAVRKRRLRRDRLKAQGDHEAFRWAKAVLTAGIREAAIMSRGRPRLSVRLEPALLDRTTAKARAEGIPVSDIVRKSLTTYTEDVGPEGVMIRLTPYYREQLVKRLRDYPDQEPGAVLERFIQLALDGAWLITDREV